MKTSEFNKQTSLKSQLRSTWMAGDYDHFSRYLENEARAFYERLAHCWLRGTALKLPASISPRTSSRVQERGPRPNDCPQAFRLRMRRICLFATAASISS